MANEKKLTVIVYMYNESKSTEKVDKTLLNRRCQNVIWI